MLRRHRGHDAVVSPIKQTKALCFGAHAAHHFTPALAVRQRNAGRTGSEHDDRRSRRVNLRDIHLIGLRTDGRGGALRHRIGPCKLGQIEGLRLVGQTEHVGRKALDLAHHFRRERRRKQADFFAEQGCSHADGKAVAVRADVQHVSACWQCGGKLPDIGQKLRHADGMVVAEGNDVLSTRVREERKSDHEA